MHEDIFNSESIRCEVPQTLFPMSILTAYKFTELYGFWIWLIPVCIFLFIPFFNNFYSLFKQRFKLNPLKYDGTCLLIPAFRRLREEDQEFKANLALHSKF